MKKILGLLFLLPFFIQAQIPTPKTEKKCYDRASKNTRFATWECGQLAGVVDCNEKLTYDENANTILSANDGSAFSGTCETCFSNGLLERRITFIDGKEDGMDTTFYSSGCRMVIRDHLRGEENGQWLYYYDSTASLAWEMNYVVGDKHGKAIFFGPKGDTTLWENYKNGKLHGTKRTYYSGSKIKTEIQYMEGLMNGPFKKFSIDSVLLDDLNFKDGEKDGICTYYYNDGTLLKTENWSKGVENGEFKTFFIQGYVLKYEFYKKGLKEGEFLNYYPNQSVKRRHVYKKDALIEDHKFNESGEETYSLGAPSKSKNNEDDQLPAEKKNRFSKWIKSLRKKKATSLKP
jgi:antitoxin component YwqK of YwqJK toxin-antitoxin module